MITALLLDLANILGGFLLAIALLRRLPQVGDDLSRFAARVGPYGWLVGVVALVVAGYYLIVHLVSGPYLLHFEVVGLGVGIALLRDRLTRRSTPASAGNADRDPASGVALLLAIFGIIAIVVGIQGLFTPDG